MDGARASRARGRPATPREVRIAAVADLHFTEGLSGTLRAAYAQLSREADVLLLGGDLTNMGRPSEAEALLEELADVTVPVVAVLGNHDHEAGLAEDLAAVLRQGGVRLLDGDHAKVEVDGRRICVAGIKGFGGGFDPHGLKPFGEAALKQFLAETIHEAKKLEAAVAQMQGDLHVALLHYAPVRETMGDEMPEVYPFLGSSLLLDAIERAGKVHVVFHGHAHRGTLEARTRGGVPVYNVAMPVLRRPYHVVAF